MKELWRTAVVFLLVLQATPCRGFMVAGHYHPATTKVMNHPIKKRFSLQSSADPVESVDALDELVPRSKLKPLVQAKSNLQGALQVSFHFGLLALAASLPSTLAMAFVSAFFFNGMHETVHRTAFASKRANDFFAHLFGFLCLRPARHYFYYHWQHHKYTGNPKLDSEMQTGSFLDFPVESIFGYLFYLSGIPFWIDAISTTVKHSLGHCPEIYLPNEKAKKEITLEARIYLLFYTLIAACSIYLGKMAAVLRYWVFPAVLGQPFLRFYLLAEHRGRKESPLIFENTRTMRTNWLYRKLAWSMPYHMEHHAWPSVPFHQLHKAHCLLGHATKGQSDILSSGELDSSIDGKRGYISYNVAFVKSLIRKKRQEMIS